MGAVAVANREQGVHDNRKVVEADITFSASYATGGDTVAVADLGLVAVDRMLVPSHKLIDRKAVGAGTSQSGKSFELAGTVDAPTIKVFDAANTEVAAATDLSAVTVRLRFEGR